MGDFGRLAPKSAPCHANNAIPGELEGCVADAVLLECRAGAVELEAVELGDEPLLAPQGVHLEAFDDGVDLGSWQVEGVAEVEEVALEVGAGGRGRSEAGYEGGQGTQGPAARVSSAHVFDRADIEQVEALGSLEHALETAMLDDLGEIEEGPGDGGDRYGVVGGVVGVRKAADAMQPYALMTVPVARGGDVK